MPQPSTGVLLVNLGTPDAPTTPAVRRYLVEFLSDPRVMLMPGLVRWVLVNLIIGPIRSSKSAHAYQQVWTERGSPLLVAGTDLTRDVQAQLGDEYRVVLAMRYGKPSVETALVELQKTPLERIVVLPLFPQYASATTGSAIQHVMSALSEQQVIPALHLMSDFFEHPGFVDAQAHVVRRALAGSTPDKVLISFHGLPERHLNPCCAASSCDRLSSCPPMGPDNRSCYRAQCYATARALATAMQWTEQDYVVSFQSRMGRERWIHPYTDTALEELVSQGVQHLAVVCPAFVADCLETTEEIGLRAAAQFKALGGERLQLLPCVNADPVWVRAVAQMVRETVCAQADA